MTDTKGAALLSFWRRATRPSPRWIRMGRRYGIGHRAAFLIAFGGMFFALGIGIFLVQTPTPQIDPLLFHTQMPIPFRVALWCGTGAAAAAFARHPRYQWVSFMALAAAPVERIVSYAVAIVLAIIPGGSPGSVGTYLTMGALFSAVLFVTRLIASWPDPPGDKRP